MTSKQLLAELIKDLSKATGIPYSRKDAEEQGKESYLYADYNSTYGGYRLDCVRVSTGATFSSPIMHSMDRRLSSAKLIEKIRDFIAGYDYRQKQDEETAANADSEYIKSELSKINLHAYYGPKLKMTSTDVDNKTQETKWLNINKDTAKTVAAFLKSI